MATTYSSSAVASTVQARVGEGVISVTGSYTFTAAQVINDVIQMVKIPANAIVLEAILSSDDLDTNGSPLITMSVGDGSSTARFISASNIGQTGGTARLGANITDDTCHGYKYSAEDTIDVLIAAAPATAAYTNKSISLTVLYTLQATN